MALVGFRVHLARVARLVRVLLLLRGHLHEIRMSRVGIRDDVVELRETYLTVPIRVDHLDHHVDFFVRDELAHAD